VGADVAFHVIDRAEYEKAATSLRSRRSFKAAAAASGLDKRTCKRLWLTGRPDLGLEPIQQVVEREQVAVRAQVAREEEKHRLEAAVAGEDEARVRLVEVLVARSVRSAAIEHAARAAQLKPLGDRIAQHLAAAAVEGADLHEQVRLLNALGRYAQRSAVLARESIELERLRLGEARKVDVHLTVGQQAFDPVQAAADAELLQETLRRRAQAQPPPALEAGGPVAAQG